MRREEERGRRGRRGRTERKMRKKRKKIEEGGKVRGREK